MKVVSISLVIPCYNEELTLREFYRRVVAVADEMHGRRFEFIFVNDGSTDRTQIILNNLANDDDQVKVLHLAGNPGHQIALTAGLDHGSADMIVTIDADLQDPPELIQDMLQRIEADYDIVHAQRRRRYGESLFKLAAARFFYRLMKWFAKSQIIEDCGDFRAISRPVHEAVIAFRTPHRFLRGIFAQIGFNQCIIPYNRDARYAGATKYPFFKMLTLSIDAVLGFTPTPIRAITWLSIGLWAVSMTYLLKSLVDHFIRRITVPGWTSIIVMLFFFTGLILFCMAIIGAYVGRIFEQGQQRPLYWLCDARNLELKSVGSCGRELREVVLSERILNQRKKQES